MKRIACLMVALGATSPVFAQSTGFTGILSDNITTASMTQPAIGVPPVAKTVSLAGPRFGQRRVPDLEPPGPAVPAGGHEVGAPHRSSPSARIMSCSVATK